MFTVRCKKRDELIDFLKSKKIATTVYIKPYLYIRSIKYRSTIPSSLKIWKDLVTIPTYPNMTLVQQNYVIKNLKEFDNKFKDF